MSSSAAVAISSVALAEASAAKTQACKATVQAYKPESATVANMRSYAECVQRLHPQDLSEGAVIIVKVAIILVLIGAVVGAWRGWSEGSYGKWINTPMGFFMGALAVVGGLLVLGIVVAAVGFLFS